VSLSNRGARALLASAALGVLLSSAASAESPGSDTEERATLDRQSLVSTVLARNPGVSAALEAVAAAEARVPQVTSLDDPMVSYGIAPLSIYSSEVPFGQRAQIEQRLPFPGKLRLAGEAAELEARASREELEAVRLDLSRMASTLFDDWYVAHRALRINAQHIELLEALKHSAEAQYVVGKASQQDPLQAEAELVLLQQQRIGLEANREIVRASINGLLHKSPNAAVPPPPEEVRVDPAAPDSAQALWARALESRPELEAERARVRANEVSLALAHRQYLPDLGLMASYDSMWMDFQHRYMVGLSINLPIYLGKRKAAVDEAQAELSRMKHSLARRVDEIQIDVERARQRVIESLNVLHLYETRLVPIARDRLEAARAGFKTGSNTFPALMEAEKNLRSVELDLEIARGEVERRRAELDRAVGVLPGQAPVGVSK
jgi:outer membrane protein TolC